MIPNVISDVLRDIGVYTTSTFSIPLGAVAARVSMDRGHIAKVTTTKNNRNLTFIYMEVSQDGGANWAVQGGCGVEGGEIYKGWSQDTKRIMTETVTFIALPNPTNGRRRAQFISDMKKKARIPVSVEWIYN